ncbi:hypothetical protein KI387_044238 [Taxus chinensis]|uniref:HAT C-terminal dimerisation domain-containing protein n=1 Tax=Taxus chinensis TaxID=29808 RepID=A0AA38CGY5_TAXCH|nr:hypothetical protein KI387_044238 [Taxus chinensis]
MSQAIFRRFSTLELLKVAETRFASHTLVLRRLVKVKQALRLMVIDDVWTVWRQSNTERAIKVKSVILDDIWWAKVAYLLSFTEPILSMIRYTDTDNACIGEIYDGIDSMLEKIRDIIQQKEQDPEEKFYSEVKNVIMRRWNKMTTPLHLLAYALNPKFYSSEILALPGRQKPYDDHEVASGAKAAFRRLFPDPDVTSAVRCEMTLFVSSSNSSMGEIDATLDRYKMPPCMWWCAHGHDAKWLRPVAIKILSQVASNSSAERNWSTYSFIHSVKRNKLASKKAEDLVYVHSNLRILSHKSEAYVRGPNKLWDIEPETSDFDASAATLSQLSLLGIDEEESGSFAEGRESGASGSGDVGASAVHGDDYEEI